MLPWQLACTWQRENATESFEDVLGWHLSNGVVLSTAHVFMLAKEVCWSEETEQIIPGGTPNAWFVELAASSGKDNLLKRCLEVAPVKHKWACWCRRNEPRVKAFRWEAIKKKAGGT